MNDIIVDYIATGVEMVVTAVILSALVTIYSASAQINHTILEQQAISAELTEYRKHAGYDYSHVYSQDIVAAIFKYRGSPEVIVKYTVNTTDGHSAGERYEWTLYTMPLNSTWSVSSISTFISPAVVWDSNVIRDANGVVVGYEFVTHDSTCTR